MRLVEPIEDQPVDEKGQVGHRIEPGTLGVAQPLGNIRVLPRESRSAAAPPAQPSDRKHVDQVPVWMVEVQQVIERAAELRARELVAQAVEAERATWRDRLDGPTADDAVRAVLAELERAVRTAQGTYVGAHLLAVRAARAIGVPGLEDYPILRRTRGQIEADQGG
jgi:hypothetical protein